MYKTLLWIYILANIVICQSLLFVGLTVVLIPTSPNDSDIEGLFVRVLAYGLFFEMPAHDLCLLFHWTVWVLLTDLRELLTYH